MSTRPQLRRLVQSVIALGVWGWLTACTPVPISDHPASGGILTSESVAFEVSPTGVATTLPTVSSSPVTVVPALDMYSRYVFGSPCDPRLVPCLE